jgi:hypothetical protein
MRQHRRLLGPRRRLAGSGFLLAVAGILVLAGAANGSSSTNAQKPPPRSLGPPVVAGEAQTGEILRASLGPWDRPTVRRATFSFQWQRCDADGGGCVDVVKARDSIYPVRRADLGRALRVVVTATKDDTSTSMPSAVTEPVARAEEDAPVNLARPTITGETTLGEVLSARAGAWTGEQPIDVEYHWRSCNQLGGSCRDLERAGQTYSPRRSDVDRTLRVLVLAENEVETSAAMSDPTAFVTAPASPAVAPNNVTEPRITGTTRVGQVLRSSRGTWTGTEPISFEFRWFNCEDRGAPDASDCRRITNASDNTYVLRQGDAGFRIRSQVVARNSDGQDTATSNPTSVVTAARPVSTDEPSISGTARVGSRLTASRGQWAGDQPITYTYVWLRCNDKGENCSEIPGANDTNYEVRDADAGRTIRVRVVARNDRGTTSALSNPTGVVGSNQPRPQPNGTLPVGQLQAAGDRLVVTTVQFSPNPVTSRTAPITARVRVTARGGRPVSGAAVFMRATPRVVQGQTLQTQADGWVTLTLVPNRLFPQPRSGFNVQFFIKASRPGDPGLGGIAGFRLVQVPLADT